MAHTKAQGSSRNGRDSNPKYLGVKMYGGQAIRAGQIILKQRGTRLDPGWNVRAGKDDTLYAISDGVVQFRPRRVDVVSDGPARR